MDNSAKKICAGCLLGLAIYGSALCEDCLSLKVPDLPVVHFSMGPGSTRMVAVSGFSDTMTTTQPLFIPS